MDENAYAMVLNQVLKKLEVLGVRDVEVWLYCEGMDGASKIPSAISWELIDFNNSLWLTSRFKISAFPLGLGMI